MRSGQRRALLSGACVALIFALASCASGGVRSGGSPTPSAGAFASPRTTATSDPDAFVCANPHGSSVTYAYVGRSGQLSLVRGCSAPVAVPAPAGRQFTPIAFSPTGMRLLAWNALASAQQPDTQSCLALIEVSSGAVTPTTICSLSAGANQLTHWFSLIGWSSDASFYLADTAQDASVTVLLVSLPQQTQTVVTTFTWVAEFANASEPAGIALRGDALYYGGYMSGSEGGAWLHRFSLTTHTDARIVRLGLAGGGGCQVSATPCTWTGPWDISQDGSEIVYHNPGPTESISDTTGEANTPLYLAASDGSGVRRLFPGQSLGLGFNQPAFSPDGRYVITTFPNSLLTMPHTVVIERLSDGSQTTAPAELGWQNWALQPGVAVMYNTVTGGAPDYITHLELYNVATGARTALQPGTTDYVWA